MLCTCMSLKKTSRNGKRISVEPLYCRSWQCEICRPRRKARCVREANAGEPTAFVTLTVNPHWYGDEHERARRLVEAWRALRKAICRRYNYKKISFYAVMEKTKRGEPHLHILWRLKWVDQKFISDVMKRLNGAPIVDIRRIWKPGGAAKYLAKYLGKDPQVFEGCKRYWKSQDWLDTKTHREWLAMLPDDIVEVVRERWWEYATLVLTKLGYVQIDENRKYAICFPNGP